MENAVSNKHTHHERSSDDNKENISSNIKAPTASKPGLSFKEPETPDKLPSLHASSTLEGNKTDSRMKSSLRGQGSRIFIPKGNRPLPPQEFKIEFMISPERAITLRVTKDSNPLKLADYVLDQVVGASKERGEELPQQQKGKVLSE